MKDVLLTRGMYALVDDEDFDRVVCAGRWNAYAPQRNEHHKYWYAWHSVYATGGRRRNQSMHRFIMREPEGFLIDHVNGDGLDNRRSNLRICTRAQNQQNRRRRKPGSSIYTGVYLSPMSRVHVLKKPWCAEIRGNHIGMYSTQEDAAHAYDELAKQLYGAFAALNFPVVAA